MNELFGRLPAFWVRDELYRHAWGPENCIHFEIELEDGREPVVWTRQHGLGRVCYLALGHVEATLRHPSVRQILHHGLNWVASPGGERHP